MKTDDMFIIMDEDDKGGFIIYTKSLAEAKIKAYKTVVWALAHGYGPYSMSFGPDSVRFSCPGLADMTFKVNDR